jgi:hypothetical protein
MKIFKSYIFYYFIIMKIIYQLFLSSSLGLSFVPISLAQNPPNETSFFTGSPPTLASVTSPHKTVNWPYPHYYFTIAIPSNCQQALGLITIFPQPSISPVTFNLQDTKAFLGERGNRGKMVSINTTQAENGLISVFFDSPIPSGSKVTVSLEAWENPSVSGIYQYTVKAFPAGTNPVGLNLGVGRISIYSNNR